MQLTLAAIQSLLLDIQRETKIYPICAGGAIRDIIHNRPVKDIDLFLPVDENYTKLDKFFRARDGSHAKCLDYKHRESKYSTGKAITAAGSEDYDSGFSVYNVRYRLQGYPIQLIEQYDDFDIEEFDIGLCQAALNPDTLRTTSAFKRDSLNKTITALKPSNGDHLERVKAKYPDFRLRRAY